MYLKSLAFCLSLACVYNTSFAQEVNADTQENKAAQTTIAIEGSDDTKPIMQVNYQKQDIRNFDNAVNVPITDGIDQALVSAYLQYTKNVLLDNKLSIKLINDVSNAVLALAIDNNTLKVVFDDTKINQVAQDNKKQVFFGAKSSLIAFVVVNSNGTTSIAQGPDSSTFLTRLNSKSESLNFSMLYPLLDLNDIQTFNEQSVLAHNDQALAKAAMRYGSEFFISATLKHEGGGFINFTYNLYNSQGERLLGERLIGQEQEIANKLAQNLALSIANVKAGVSVSQLSTMQRIEDVYELGPKDGFVRMSISEANSLFDIANIKKILISYGYESDVKIVAVHGHDLIIEIPTNSSPAILDGTMRNARDFKKIGSWQYTYLKSIN